MKKLILLLLVPILSYSQISYKDIMSIKSVDMFKRVVIENGYEFDTEEEGWISYGVNIVRYSNERNKSTKWAGYNKNNGEFSFQFVRRTILGNLLGTEDDTSENPYDLIVGDIKNRCKYYKIINYKGIDYVTYSCTESTYKGKIGVVVSEGLGIIRHFPKTDKP